MRTTEPQNTKAERMPATLLGDRSPGDHKETSRRPLRDRHDSRRSSEDYQTHPENTMKTIHDEHQQQTSRRGHDPLGVRDDPM